MHQTKQVLTRLIGETKGQISGDASAVDRKGSGLREVLGPNSSATSSPTASMDGSNSNISADQNDENISPSRFRRADAHENETQQSRSSLLKGGLFLRGGAIKFQPGLSAHQL